MTTFQPRWLVPVLKPMPLPLSLLILYIAVSSVIHSHHSILPVNETVGNISVYDWKPSTPSLTSMSYGRPDFDTFSASKISRNLLPCTNGSQTRALEYWSDWAIFKFSEHSTEISNELLRLKQQIHYQLSVARLFIPYGLGTLNSNKPKDMCSSGEVIRSWGTEVCVYIWRGRRMSQSQGDMMYMLHHTRKTSAPLCSSSTFFQSGWFLPLTCLFCVPS